ncbi:helix-turn-helix domain-containing protein [Pseudomonas sp. NY15356]|uniref:helix-turn-helix domain-containing protein n=1 Tax=unclassified Pseudomonas TaxID=196821 RepID=UPI003A8C5326
MTNIDIAQQIAEDAEVFCYARRGAPILEIRRIMSLKGLKNIDLAERLGVSEANISRWLRGDQNLKLDTIYSLADAVQERLDLCFGESHLRQFLTDMKYSESEAQEFVVGVNSLEDYKSYARFEFFSCNDEEYGEVEANEGCFAFG